VHGLLIKATTAFIIVTVTDNCIGADIDSKKKTAYVMQKTIYTKFQSDRKIWNDWSAPAQLL
jgi:hypothetical protein